MTSSQPPVTAGPPQTVRPVIVRLRNWVGDVVLGIPAIRRLQAAGYTPWLIGKGWAADLLSGEGWRIEKRPQRWQDRRRQLLQLAQEARALDPDFDRRPNALALPIAFSAALDFRLAGLKAVGYAHEGRRFLLHRAVQRHPWHALEEYWRLAGYFLDPSAPDPVPGQACEPPLPRQIDMALPTGSFEAARRRLDAAGISGPYAVLCPFSGGTFEGLPKEWPDFPQWLAQEAPRWRERGWHLLVCPGPGEEDAAARDYAQATVLPKVPMGEYAALLAGARWVVSNDTGPGHLAAALGVPLVSVLGPTDPAAWGAWGDQVQTIRHWPRWPRLQEVTQACESLASPSGN